MFRHRIPQTRAPRRLEYSSGRLCNSQASLEPLPRFLRLLETRLRAEKFQFISLGRLFLFFLHLPANLVITIFGLDHHFLCFRHLTMNRVRPRRSGAAPLLPLHYRIGDSPRFLSVRILGSLIAIALHQPLDENIAMGALQSQQPLYVGQPTANHTIQYEFALTLPRKMGLRLSTNCSG